MVCLMLVQLPAAAKGNETSQTSALCKSAGKSKLLSFWDGLKTFIPGSIPIMGTRFKARHPCFVVKFEEFLIIMHGDSLQSQFQMTQKKEICKIYIFFNLINLPICGNKSSITTRRNFKRKKIECRDKGSYLEE